MGQISPLHSHVALNPTWLFLFVTADVPTVCHVLLLHWICCILCVCVFPCNMVINLSCFFLHPYLLPTIIGRRAKTGSKLTSVCRWSIFFFLHENTNFCSLACMQISHGNGRVFVTGEFESNPHDYSAEHGFVYIHKAFPLSLSNEVDCCEHASGGHVGFSYNCAWPSRVENLDSQLAL